jgi:hypothetical protein
MADMGVNQFSAYAVSYKGLRAFVLNGRSAEIRPDLTNTAKPILKKGATQI